MKIIKPDQMGLLQRTVQIESKHFLSLGLIGMFRFDHGIEAMPAALLSEQQLWAVSAAAIGSDALLDAGWPKPAGEFLAYGACYAPATGPVTERTVGIAIGALEKTLAVFGARHFKALGGISAPQPFERIEIAPSQAFGGAGYADNPLGCGYEEDRLPQVETLSALIVSRNDRPPSAGFWALPPESPQRTRLLGRFDMAWLQTRWPHLPLDTPPTYFHSAPPDQRSEEFFHGDEAFEIRHMHRQHAILRGTLPGLRARCFVQRRTGDTAAWSEISTRAETVWLFPEQECGMVLYRALAAIDDSDADDVLHVMAEWENLADAPLPFAHYHARWSGVPAQAAAPTAAPTVSAMAPQASTAANAPFSVPLNVPPNASFNAPTIDAELSAQSEQLAREIQALAQQHGVSAAALEKHLQAPPPVPILSALEQEQAYAQLEQQIQTLMKAHGISAQSIEKHLQAPPPSPPSDLAASLQQLDVMMADLMQGTPPQALQAAVAGNTHLLAELNASVPDSAALIAMQSAGTPQLATIQFAKPAAVPSSSPPPPPPPPPSPSAALRMTREMVAQWHAAQRSFAEQDLSGLDLSKLDLSAADFSRACLEKTNFSGACLHAANFSAALLREADLSAADLHAANLHGVNADHAKLREAHMADSDLRDADFTGADFSYANVRRARLGGATFEHANMAHLCAIGCDASAAGFGDADLTQADFSDATLSQACFHRASMAQANLCKSVCRQTEFYAVKAAAAIFVDADLQASRADAESQFADAIFFRARLSHANWEGAVVTRALFDQALLDDADFSRVQAHAAQFVGSSAKRTRFDKADLSRADMRGINLFKGSLRQTCIDATLLQAANLYGVDFDGTTPTIASIEGSNIDQTVLRFRAAVL